ncbi:MAG TPA: SDR family NAD(P)-dependent oxidoreductase [Casimicrobiaceae bacterium]|jgi:benzil reductase ((S)-benzoin forming)|nr:SDR family NAD(P)-dependent oxidoreductase [Casimicrobiaceae bacterium]
MKTAIVTGVSRGLGEALARTLLAGGFAVTGIGRASGAALTAPNYRFVGCDLSDTINIDAALTPAFRAIADARPEFLCLINNAATAGPVGTIGSLDGEALAASMAANLVAPIAVANLFCRMFVDPAQVRRIINVSSGAADSPLPGGGPYSIAKAGLEMLTRQLAAEHDAAMFRAITVRPGVIDTDMQTFMRSQTKETLPSIDLFKGFHREHRLVAPETVAGKIVDKLVLGDVEQGRTYNYREL